MKIHRCGQTASTWSTTDSKRPKEYLQHWTPDRAIRFDGTIDKSGDRHTAFGVEIDEEDVLALHSQLVKYLQQGVKERDRLQARVSELEEVLLKIARLISKRDRAPNYESLIEAVDEICFHFAYTREEKFRSNFKWLRWKTL